MIKAIAMFFEIYFDYKWRRHMRYQGKHVLREDNFFTSIKRDEPNLFDHLHLADSITTQEMSYV